MQMTYPNGRKLDFNYTSAVDNVMSRVTNITTDGEATASAIYTYLGAGTIVSQYDSTSAGAATAAYTLTC